MARSAEVTTALILVVGFSLLYPLAGWVARDVTAFARRVFEELPARFATVEAGQIPALFLEMILVAGKSAAPLLGAALVVGFLSQLVQVGFLVATEPLTPKLERLNPLSGLKRLFSKRSLVELLKATVKVLIVGGIAYLSVRGSFPVFVEFMEWPPLEAVQFVGLIVFRTGLWIGLAMLILAYADYKYQKWEFEKSIRMSKQEVREEHRQTEGDPQIRARIRQRQRQIASMRMMSRVPTADVVITNPVHLAVALAYDGRRWRRRWSSQRGRAPRPKDQGDGEGPRRDGGRKRLAGSLPLRDGGDQCKDSGRALPSRCGGPRLRLPPPKGGGRRTGDVTHKRRTDHLKGRAGRGLTGKCENRLPRTTRSK